MKDVEPPCLPVGRRGVIQVTWVCDTANIRIVTNVFYSPFAGLIPLLGCVTNPGDLDHTPSPNGQTGRLNIFHCNELRGLWSKVKCPEIIPYWGHCGSGLRMAFRSRAIKSGSGA